ncbi:MAG: FHA domain-containing protein [Clostridiales bacterium]|nr:FHA domain-containing protein [Clostridiales bacterium]
MMFITAREWRAARRARDLTPPPIGSLTDDAGRQYALGHDSVLGRSRRCDIVLSDAGVAGVHAQIYERRRTVFLQPLARGKVFLNGAALSGRAKLQSGDTVGLGETALTVRLCGRDQGGDEAGPAKAESQCGTDV